MMLASLSTLEIAQALISIPTVTPAGSVALDWIASYLAPYQAVAHRQTFHDSHTPSVDNMLICLGEGEPHFCFAGHVDVVPVGYEGAWHTPPFGAVVQGGVLYGRGASDMKGAIAAFLKAATAYVEARGLPQGTISLLLTSDEEGPALNGTKKMLEWMDDRGLLPTVCLVGEPTSHTQVGDQVKVGRRGSLNLKLTVKGTGGHVAYPHLATNPIPLLAKAISHLASLVLDEGMPPFSPSHLTFSSLGCENMATNVIPEEAQAQFNIRFNPLHTAESLMEKLHADLSALLGHASYTLTVLSQGNPFLSDTPRFTDLVTRSIRRVTGLNPDLSTSGGTSDARFIHEYCPVMECGLLNKSIHKPNEEVCLKDLETLEEIYGQLLENFFQDSEGVFCVSKTMDNLACEGHDKKRKEALIEVLEN